MLLLFMVFFGLSLECIAHVENRSTTGSTENAGRVLRMSVSHVYDAHSPLRPKECGAGDEGAACLSAHHWQRLFNHSGGRSARSINKESNNMVLRGGRRQAVARRELLVTPWADVWSESWHRGRTFDYYAALSIGTPPQPQLLFLDTGSDLSWIQCKPCKPCYPQGVPVFDGAHSSTLRLQTINDPFCQAVQQTYLGTGADAASCSYAASYEDSTTSDGDLVFDDITFSDLDGNPGDYVTFHGLAFGCGTSNFVAIPTVTSGTLALAKSRGLSIPEQLASTLGADFSYCLAPPATPPNSGFIYLGAGSIPATPYDQTNFVANAIPDYWYIDIIDIIVGSSFLRLPSGTLEFDPTTGRGGTIIDTGTFISRLTGAAYIPFRDAWRLALRPLLGDPGTGIEGFDTCYDYPNDMDLPVISFYFQDDNIFTPSNNANMYIYTSNSGHRRMCWPYTPTSSDSFGAFILGANTQISTRMIFDTQNQRLGWIYNSC